MEFYKDLGIWHTAPTVTWLVDTTDFGQLHIDQSKSQSSVSNQSFCCDWCQMYKSTPNQARNRYIMVLRLHRQTSANVGFRQHCTLQTFVRATCTAMRNDKHQRKLSPEVWMLLHSELKIKQRCYDQIWPKITCDLKRQLWLCKIVLHRSMINYLHLYCICKQLHALYKSTTKLCFFLNKSYILFKMYSVL